MSWLQSPSAVILDPKKIKSVTVSIDSPSICHEVMGPDAMIFIFWMLSFKPTFSLSSFTFIKRLFSFCSLSAVRVVSSAYLRLLVFLLAILIPVCASSSLAFHMIYSAYTLHVLWCTLTSLVAQMVKHLPTIQEIWVRSLGQEDLLEKEMATHSSTLTWKTLWTEEAGRLVHEVTKSWTWLSDKQYAICVTLAGQVATVRTGHGSVDWF